ncbi:MAG: hypothetical protein ACLRP3_10075 [Escherichia sp.]
MAGYLITALLLQQRNIRNSQNSSRSFPAWSDGETQFCLNQTITLSKKASTAHAALPVRQRIRNDFRKVRLQLVT